MQSLFILPITKYYLFHKSSIIPLQHVLYKIVLRRDDFNRILWVKSKNKNPFYHNKPTYLSPFLSSSSSSFTFKLSIPLFPLLSRLTPLNYSGGTTKPSHEFHHQ